VDQRFLTEMTTEQSDNEAAGGGESKIERKTTAYSATRLTFCAGDAASSLISRPPKRAWHICGRLLS
jgi:hypothetical protein